MPQAIPYIASVAASAGTATAAQAAFVALIVSAGVASYQRTNALQRQRQQQADAIRNRNITLRSALAPRTIALGTVRTSGPLMYAEFVGSTQEYLDTIVAINHGELSELMGVYIGDEYIAAANISADVPTTGKFAPESQDPDSFEESIAVTSATTVTLAGPPDDGALSYLVLSVGSGESLVQTPLTLVSVVGTLVTFSPSSTGTVVVGYRSRPASRRPLRVQWATGSPTQATTTWGAVASAPKWTANHRLRGVAYIRTLKLIDHPLFLGGDSGDVGAVIRGPKGVWDPRTSTTLNYTSNPALLAAWYRTLPVADGGMGVPSAWIDWPSVSAAANVCDELISVRKLDGTGYENVKRYECHTRLSLDRPPAENLQIILDAMAGDSPFTAGLYKVFAGAFRAATVTLTDDDVVATDAISFAPAAGASVAPPNIVTATFYDAARGWVPQAARAVTNAAYVTADGAEELVEMDLPATTDERQANYVMGVQLERARPSLAGSLTVTGKGANLALLDTVQLNLQGYSALVGKTFEVRRRTNRWAGQYPIELREIKAASFALDADRFTAAAAVAPPVNSMLFDVAAVPVTGAAEQLVRQVDGTIISRIEMTWTAHPQGYVRDRGSIRLRWRRVGGEWAYGAPVPGSALSAYTDALAAGGELVVLEAQAVNGAGAPGPWTAAPLVQVLGKVAPPENVSGVTATAIPGAVVLSWAPNTEADYLDTEIRSGATWAGGLLVWRGSADRQRVDWPAPGNVTLWLAHRDTSHGYSPNPLAVRFVVAADGSITPASSGWLTSGGSAAVWDSAGGPVSWGASGVVGSGTLIGTPQLGANAATEVADVSASAITVTGVGGTGPQNYTSSVRWTPVATLAFTAAITGNVRLSLTVRTTFSGAGSLSVDELWCSLLLHVDWDGDLVNETGDRVLEDFARTPQTGTGVARTAQLSVEVSRAVVAGQAYSWAAYAQTLEGTVVINDFYARVEQIKR